MITRTAQNVVLLDEKSTLITSSVEMLPLVRVISAYLAFYATDNEHTARAKRSDLNFFLAFLGKETKISLLWLGDVNESSLRAFIDHRLRFDKPATINRRLATLRHFCKRISARCPEWHNPMDRIKDVGVADLQWLGVEPEQIRKLIDAAYTGPGTKFRRMRNGTMLEMLAGTGLRAAELLGLTLGHLSDDMRWLSGVRCKGKRFRDVYIPAGLKQPLTDYLALRKLEVARALKVPPKPEQPLFVSLRHSLPDNPDTWRASYKTLWEAITRAAERANIPHIHPHQLRHSLAQRLLGQTKDIRLVAQALGHKSISHTMRYTARHPDEFANAIEEALRKK